MYSPRDTVIGFKAVFPTQVTRYFQFSSFLFTSSHLIYIPLQDFKKTTKLTWLAESSKASLLPTITVHFDNVISKAVLTKTDDFKNYINKDSKVGSYVVCVIVLI